MSEIKLGINTTMAVRINLDASLSADDIESIEFLFKQSRGNESESLKTASYKSNGSGDVERNEDVFYIPWTRAETYKFKPQKPFYLDTRITFVGSRDNPITPITQLMMDDSLFGEGE